MMKLTTYLIPLNRLLLQNNSSLFLIDIGNFVMIEFSHSSYPRAFVDGTGSENFLIRTTQGG